MKVYKYLTVENIIYVMPKNVVEASEGVAEAVKLCNPDVLAVYPITPQSM